jgi:hypothetical protein
MTYRNLKIDPGAPTTVRQLVKQLESHYLSDVHSMLRLPIPNYRILAGCNFAIAQVLLATIGGVSTTLYSHSGGKGKRFKDLLVDYYPWKHEPHSTVTPSQAAEIIYSVFRNPLTHDLGLDIEKKAKTPLVKLKRRVTKNKTRGLPEKEIEALEKTAARPNMSATVVVRPDATVLLVEALYWGVRGMIEELVADKARMKAADSFLASL